MAGVCHYILTFLPSANVKPLIDIRGFFLLCNWPS